MAALDYLRRAGLTVEAVADKLRVSPFERISPELRRFIVEHKARLLAELGAGTSRTAAPAPTPPPPPAPGAEAASEPQRIVRTAATASPAWIVACDQFHNHIFGDCPGCHPPTGRYCQTGAELRATYHTTPMELTP